MKKILVPTDFSDNAANALEYAISLAQIFKADIQLVHSFYLSSKSGMFISVQDRMRENATEDLRRIVIQNQMRLPEGNTMDYRLVRDHAPEGIAYLAQQAQADLIVMGTKGASRAKGVLWGSVAAGVIAKTDRPLLTVPEGYTAKLPEKVVLAVDTPDYKNEEVLRPLTEITRQLSASITTFHTSPLSTATEGSVSPGDYLTSISDEYHQAFDQNVKGSLMSYVNEHDANLLCMIRKEHGFIKDLVRRSHTRKAVFECPIPMLILHEKS